MPKFDLLLLIFCLSIFTPGFSPYTYSYNINTQQLSNLKNGVVESENHKLLNAIQTGNLKQVQHSIATGADIEIRTEYDVTICDDCDQTALMLAVSSNAPQAAQIVQFLLAAGADVNARTKFSGRTALMIAAESNAVQINAIIQALLKAGAEIDALSYDPEPSLYFMPHGNALMYAILADNEQSITVMLELLQAGAGKNGMAALAIKELKKQVSRQRNYGYPAKSQTKAKIALLKKFLTQ